MGIHKIRKKLVCPSIETDALDAGTQTIGTTEIADLGITTGKLAADAVTNAKLADNAVQAENIKDGEVGTAELGTNALAASVTGLGKMQDGYLSADAGGRAKMANGFVTVTQLGTDAVETAKIKDANVTTGKLATGAVTPVKTADIPILYNLGAPVLADVDRIVVSVAMAVGAYIVAAQPDVCRNLTVKRVVVAGGETDTGGTIDIVGTDYNNAALTETIAVGADGVTVAGTKCFKTVTSVTGVGWVISGGNDTIEVGVGTLIGLPVIPAAIADVLLGILGVTITAHNPAVGATIDLCNINMSAGTYDGSKLAMVFIQN